MLYKYVNDILSFFNRHELIVLTTHDPADADGLGAQMVMASILRKHKIKSRIINASAIPAHFDYMDARKIVEQWDPEKHGSVPEYSGLLMLDTADENTTGPMKDIIGQFKEVFVIDHHESKDDAVYKGIIDSTAASTCEMTIDLAKTMGTFIDKDTAFAAYVGIAYDTGFFAYPKTGAGTFRAALMLYELGVQPYDIYHRLRENNSLPSLLLQKKAIASMTLHCNNRVAVQMLRAGDFAETGALPEETEGFVNFPLRAGNIAVSLFLKETPDKNVRCSLRSKGKVNVAKIAQEFNGGGHHNAAGFKSDSDINRTMEAALEKISAYLDKA